MPSTDFTHRPLPHLGRPVHRLGLALNYGIDAKGFDLAIERGMNFFFFTQFKTGHLVPSLQRALAADRAKYVVACGPSVGFFGGSVRKACEKKLRQLKTDYVDVFQLFWLGVGSAWSDGTIDALRSSRRRGRCGPSGSRSTTGPAPAGSQRSRRSTSS